MRFTAVALVALLGLAAAAPVADPEPQLVPSGEDIRIESINYAGTGCPAGSVATSLTDDKTLLTLAFDKYTAQSGPHIQPVENRKNCQLTLKLKYPHGFQYSIFTADYRGFAAIKKGSTGTCKSTYYFSGMQQQASLATEFKGPFEDDYLKHDELDVVSMVWSPCGQQGMLNINSQVRVTPIGSDSANLLTVDSTDLKFKNIFGLKWRKCPGK